MGAEVTADCETIITGVSTDTRTIRHGDCFFAIHGDQFDGHDYVHEAFAKGAACAVVSRAMEGEPGPLLRVPDTIRALGDLAREYRRMNSFKVVAITGSVGKTTTRQIVHHVLSRHFRTHQAQKSFNNDIGLPLTLLGARPEDEVIVTELGANHPGEVAGLTRIAQPDIAVVTNAHPAHLEGFGDLDTIVREKLSIAEGLTDGGVFIINGDIEPLVAACRSRGRPFRTFGKSPGVDYQAESVVCSGTHSTFTIRSSPIQNQVTRLPDRPGGIVKAEGLGDGSIACPQDHRQAALDDATHYASPVCYRALDEAEPSLRDKRIHLPLPGPGNVENALAAWAVCDQFGLTVEEFAGALADLSAVSMRAETLQIGRLTVLNDCYNANPASMRNALAILHNLRSCCDSNRARRLVFICGRMAELGPQTESLHADLGAAAAEAGVDLFVAVGPVAKIAAEAARAMSRRNLQTLCFDEARCVCDHVQEFIRRDDIILVKGSRTARLECVVDALRLAT